MIMRVRIDSDALMCDDTHRVSSAPSQCFLLRNMGFGFIGPFTLGFMPV